MYTWYEYQEDTHTDTHTEYYLSMGIKKEKKNKYLRYI